MPYLLSGSDSALLRQHASDLKRGIWPLEASERERLVGALERSAIRLEAGEAVIQYLSTVSFRDNILEADLICAWQAVRP